MIELSELLGHLNRLPKKEWSKLFDLLPELEKPQEFGRMGGLEKSGDDTQSFPFSISSEIVSKFLRTVNELNILPAFDWGAWMEGKEILHNKEENYNKLDILTLCKLMTYIIRSNRFSDGALVGSFEDGRMQKIIRALKHKNESGNVSYYLKVYDNYHYMEESDTYLVKGIGTSEEALRRAKAMVESFFEHNWKPGMDYGTVSAMYTMFGEDPVIFSEAGENVKFSAWTYAEQIAMPIVLRLELKNASTQRLYQLIIKYVAEKHIDQKVPGTELPYLVHLSNVAMEIMMAAQHSKDFNIDFALKVALLHDVVEDTSVTTEEIAFIFGDAVLEAVLVLTKNSELPKEERMIDSLKRIRKKRREVWAVKMADRITNLQPPPADWSMKKRKEYAEEATLIYDHLQKGNPYLADRLKAMIEEYKGYHNNKVMQESDEQLQTTAPVTDTIIERQRLDFTDNVMAVLFGVAVGDALGVPVEFRSRADLRAMPITDMVGYGTYNLPPGTFSDDSSLTFCLAEALTKGYDLQRIADNFIKWKEKNFWTARGEVFDIGNTTRDAIQRLKEGIQPDLAGGFDETENGNGSLMRILPLLFYIKDMPENDRFRITKEVSSITHAHIRSVIACFYYLEFARLILEGKEKSEIYFHLQDQTISFLNSMSINPDEISLFDRLLKQDISNLSKDEIQSTGYVIHTLEASIWCLLTTNNYQSAVLKAVNLGDDTDTTGAVTGGLAGLVYGFHSIPSDWSGRLARRIDIENLVIRLAISMRG